MHRGDIAPSVTALLMLISRHDHAELFISWFAYQELNMEELHFSGAFPVCLNPSQLHYIAFFNFKKLHSTSWAVAAWFQRCLVRGNLVTLSTVCRILRNWWLTMQDDKWGQPIVYIMMAKFHHLSQTQSITNFRPDRWTYIPMPWDHNSFACLTLRDLFMFRGLFMGYGCGVSTESQRP